MNHSDKEPESGSETLSSEEIVINELIAKIENSDNPTLDLSILLENANSHAAKTHQKISSGSKAVVGKYTAGDKLPSIPVIRQKVLNSKLTDDQKLVLLHVLGDSQPGKAMSTYYKEQRAGLPLTGVSVTIAQNNSNPMSL